MKQFAGMEEGYGPRNSVYFKRSYLWSVKYHALILRCANLLPASSPLGYATPECLRQDYDLVLSLNVVVAILS